MEENKSNVQQFNESDKDEDYKRQIEILENEISSIKEDYNNDEKYKDDVNFIKYSEMLKQIMDEYKINSPELFKDKEDVKENVIAFFDKGSGNYIQVEAKINKEKNKVLTDLKENEEITLDKILDELLTRTDIKTLTLDVHVNGKTEEFVTSDKPGKSISDAVEKIREVVKDFKDIVIVYSKEELEHLQKEWRERNGIEEPAKSNKVEEKGYEDVKSEFVEKINNNENVSKGYIRVSDDDFNKLGNILDNNELPYVANKSDRKDGINITVPIDKMDNLKEILISKDVECLQIVHGNIDWQKIKDDNPNVFANVTKEDFINFQGINNDKYKYIAFENNKGFSVYTEKSCNIKVKNLDKKEKTVQKDATEGKNNKKRLYDIKQSVDDAKKENNLKETQNKEKTEKVKKVDKSSNTIEKSKNNKER